ncbi:hypothetical protein [Methylopila sp. M107]|uniref:hypothetical protein n=1 Tax=Methylopila sp. M107 TaxID=1101190 RepID=UPI00037E5200|nr:hypothetical protein [Methylopila sp. M107]
MLSFVDRRLDEIDALSDDELLAEAQEAGQDPAQVAGELRSLIDGLIRHQAKERLRIARASLDARRVAMASGSANVLSFEKKQAILKGFAENDGRLRERLTMAARNGQGSSEREVDSILQDLRDLGVIDEDGNPL